MKSVYKILILILIVCFGAVFANSEAFCAKKSKKGPTEIDVQVRDGFHITGVMHLPKGASAKHKVPIVLFLHSIGKDLTEWSALPAETTSELGVASLAIDFRGHGKSVLNKNSKKVFWQYYRNDDEFKKYPYDIVDVLKYVKEHYPEIDTTKVAIAGSALGANMGLIAGSMNINAKSIIMLSPMLAYKGYDLRLAIVKYGAHPLLFIVSKKDSYPYNSSLELIKFAQGKQMLKVYPSGGTGVELIRYKPDCKSLIINWIKEGLIGKNAKPEQKH